MLKAFRDNLKRLMWILWLVIAAFILLVFVDFGGAGYRNTAQTDSTAATVGGETISLDDFRRQYQQSERQAQAIYGANYTPELGRQLGIAVQALDGLIAKHILTAEAERLGLAVSAEELRAEILEIPGFQENGVFIGQDEYQRTLRANGFTVADFERELRGQLLVQKLRDVLSQTLYVTDQEIESSYRDQVERAAIRYVQVDAGRFTDAAAPTSADLDAYFQAHRADFRVPERRSVDYLIVEPRLLRSTIQLEEAELRAYYDSNIAEFTDEQQVRARHILLTADGPEAVAAGKARIEDLKRRIAAGEDFAALARQYSQDETTKDRGGELGFFGRGRYNPQLEEAAFAGKPGDLVGPIESDLLNQTGLDLIQIMDRREGGVADFESVRPRIQSRLLNDRSQAAAENVAKELGNKIKEDKLTTAEGMRGLAQGREGVAFESAGPFTRDDNVAGFGRGTAFTAKAFELERGKISEPLQVARGWVVVRVASIEEARLPELAEVEQKVKDAVQIEKAKEAALAALRQSADKVRAGGASLEQIATELGAEVKSSGSFNRSAAIGELGREPAVSDAVFALDTGGVGGPVATRTGAVIFQVDERTKGDSTELATRRDELREQVTNQRLENLLLSIVEERRLKLEVHYNQQLLESFGVLQPAATG
ncbi:MAG TPA: peptidyl-prolyl cis-trans isomerase [Thermoanaerobaculia bacterium]|jgi:peptidyl-prolyl cis-trans isomerase D|nr:peptidyl-prolyl cis-trans isomerase [Thermoanaerobaculia bacterium]